MVCMVKKRVAYHNCGIGGWGGIWRGGEVGGDIYQEAGGEKCLSWL